MPIRSRKHQQVKTVQAIPDRGLDLSQSPVAIHANALTRAYNLWYEPQLGGLVTRYGMARANAPQLPAVITELHYHVMQDGTGYLLAATSDSMTAKAALHKLTEGPEGKVWEKLTDLETKGGDAPGLLSFDGMLLIADGRDSGLMSWDGETIKEVAGSPKQPTVVDTIANRVVCNSLTSPDAVFFSEPEQYDKWSVTSGGAAVIVPAGFGEGMTINGFADLYGMLIVSKVHRDAGGNITAKRLHLINTQGTPASWSGVQLSQTSSASNLGAITGIADRAYMLDSDGPHSLQPSPGGAFGDISIDPKMGPAIHPLIANAARRADHAAVVWLRNLAQIWFIVRGGGSATVVVYHPMQGGGAWTELSFPVAPRTLCEVGTRVYMAGDDGRLYMLAPGGTDWTPDGDAPIYTTLRTKLYEQMGGDLILRGIKLGIGRIFPTEMNVEAIDQIGGRHLIISTTTAETGSAQQKIYDAHSKIANSKWKIGGTETPVPQYFDWRANVRKAGMYLQVRTVGGRVTFESVTANFAVVG